MGENGFEIIRKYMYILKIKSTYLNALLSFLLSSRFSNRSDAFLASFSFFATSRFSFILNTAEKEGSFCELNIVSDIAHA